MAIEKKNVVLFPYMAQGHLIPFLALANLIHDRRPDLIITIVNTPLNIHKLKSILPPDSAVRLHALPFDPAEHGLPPGGENHDALPPHHVFRLFYASQSLREDFHGLLAGMTEPPLCVVADFLLGWTVEVVMCLGVFHTTFNTSGAYGMACYLSLWLHLPHWKTSSPEFHLPEFPEHFRLHRSQVPAFMSAAAADASDQDQVAHTQKQFTLSCVETNGILCNTVEELEVFGLEMLRKITGRQVWPVGALNSIQTHSGKEIGIGVDSCVEWLDAHRPRSVVYISFGSHETISASQMIALAAGLEACGVPFVWVVRPPASTGVERELKDAWLPEGFEARVTEAGRGLLVKEWAPQLAVLGHRSTGAFLSHCGWNSVIESLGRGVPIVGWPLSMEQFYNSKMVAEELGVGLEVARGAADEVDSGRIAAAIRLVVAEEKGKEIRRKAMELSEKIKAATRVDGGEGEHGDREKGSSIKALDDFIGTVTNAAVGCDSDQT